MVATNIFVEYLHRVLKTKLLINTVMIIKDKGGYPMFLPIENTYPLSISKSKSKLSNTIVL